MHAALEASDRARPSGKANALPGSESHYRPRLGEGRLWVVGLLGAVSLSLADGLLFNVVAYERDTSVFYPLSRTSVKAHKLDFTYSGRRAALALP